MSGRPHRDDRRDAILACIADSWAEHGRGPTYREIAERAGPASETGVGYHLRILAEAGCIERGSRPGLLRVVDE